MGACPRAVQGGDPQALLVAPALGLAHWRGWGSVEAEKCAVGTPAAGLPGPHRRGCRLCWGGPEGPDGQCAPRTCAPGEDSSCPALWAPPGRVQILRAGAAHPVKTELPLRFGDQAWGQGARRVTRSPASLLRRAGFREPQPGPGPASRSQHKQRARCRPSVSYSPRGSQASSSLPLGVAVCEKEARAGGRGAAPRRDRGSRALRGSPTTWGRPRGPGWCAMGCSLRPQ